MFQVTESEIENRLHHDNPWWREGEKLPGYPHTRVFFDPFYTLATRRDINRATLLLGARRVGKTVMMRQAIARLRDSGTVGNRVFFADVQQPLYTGLRLDQLVTLFLKIHGHSKTDPLYIFFDEVQYVRNWEVQLKVLVDDYPGYKFIVSGSAAAALRLKSNESGAGLFTDFHLPPLLFGEYLDFINYNGNLPDVVALNEKFVDYVNFGGFPEITQSAAAREDPGRFIGNDIVDRVLLRDLPSLYGISDTLELSRFFSTLALNTGEEISLEKLAANSGVSKNTLKRYMEYLEAAFLIRRIYRIDQSGRRFQKDRTFKVYLTNASLRAAMFGAMDECDPRFGKLVETVYLAHFSKFSPFDQDITYARWNKTRYEVDFIQLLPGLSEPAKAIEIKWTDHFVERPEELAGLEKFLEENMDKRDLDGEVLSKTYWQDDYYLGPHTVRCMPVSIACLVLSNLISGKKRIDPQLKLDLSQPGT